MPKTLRVLFVDDDSNDTALLLRELRRSGYEIVHERVDTAAGLEQALAKGSWDVVLADYSMPHFDGIRALSVARGNGHDGPFILVSGTIGEEVAVLSMKAGADDYVMKGSLTRLVPAIEREMREAETRRQRAAGQRDLELSQERFRRLFEAATDGFLLTDRTGLVAEMNPAAETILGVSRPAFIGQELARLFGPEDAARLRGAIQELAAFPETSEVIEVRRGGDTDAGKILEIRVRPLTVPGEPQSLAVIVHDATAEREALVRKQESERLTFVAQLAAYVAHELNTPLQNIALLTNAARRFGSNQELVKRLDRIDSQRKRAASIITDVMRLGRGGPMRLEDVDLRSIIEVAIGQVEPFRKPQIRFEKQLGAKAVAIRADPLQLQQVFVNLLKNALQATERGSVRVEIVDREGTVTVTVSDTGSGMSPGTLDRLFQPFFTTKAEGSGTGLGLAFSKRIVESHGGEIRVTSAPGKGSTFIVTLPKGGAGTAAAPPQRPA
jgi:PAS domain S-box-containing protein